MLFQKHTFCMEMTVLERQQARLEWLHQQNNNNNNNKNYGSQISFLDSMHQVRDLFDANGERKPGMYLASGVLPNCDDASMTAGMEYVANKIDFVQAEVATSSNHEIDHCLSRTCSCHKGVLEVAKMEKEVVLLDEASEGVGVALIDKMQSLHGGDSSNKRKAEFELAEECKDKRIKGAAEVESKSKSKGKSCTEISADSSKENQKKQDYIHVRARRGQATESHSLAERARREKISKKMKCLQDLVPGCNKITGRAGMLDEIINYVQSLQRQVEFLSMKLAALTPRLESSTDNFSMKELSAYAAKFSTLNLPSVISNLPHLQANVVQQESTGSEQEVRTNPPQVTPERTANSSFIPQCLDLSFFPHIQSFWDVDLQNLHNVGFL